MNLSVLVGNVTITFTDLNLTDKPLHTWVQSIILSIISFLFTFLGILVHIRLNQLINRGRPSGIEHVILSSQFIACLYPFLIASMVLNNFIYPVSDVLSVWYCHIFVNTIDPYIRGYSHFHSLSIALLRYLCISWQDLVQKIGLKRVTRFAIGLGFVLPGILVIFMQFPIDGGYMIHHHCIGRYELRYNLADFTLPKARGYWPCSNNDTSTWFGLIWKYLCLISYWVFLIIGNNVLEIFLYAKSFAKIKEQTEKSSNLLGSAAYQTRRARNRVNIVLTFWGWIMETIAQLILYVCLIFVFGQNFFLQELLMLLSVCLNFVVLPCFYILADQEIKSALGRGDLRALFRSLSSSQP